MRKTTVKNISIVSGIIFIILITGIVIITRNYLHDEVDMCLDGGGCWDYNRNRCEMKEQGFCVRDKNECEIERHGIWLEAEKFCELNSAS